MIPPLLYQYDNIQQFTLKMCNTLRIKKQSKQDCTFLIAAIFGDTVECMKIILHNMATDGNL